MSLCFYTPDTTPVRKSTLRACSLLRISQLKGYQLRGGSVRGKHLNPMRCRGLQLWSFAFSEDLSHPHEPVVGVKYPREPRMTGL